MRLEIVRSIADWLIRDVNARIAAVPRDAGDQAPPPIAEWASTDWPATSIAVFDETRHPWVMLRQEPPATPCLYVMLERPLMLKGEPWPNGQIRSTVSPAMVSIRYVTATSDYGRGVTDGDYTIRAVARSLRELDLQANEAYRTRNGVVMPVSEDPMEFHPVVQTVGNAHVTGALVVRYMVRDHKGSF